MEKFIDIKKICFQNAKNEKNEIFCLADLKISYISIQYTITYNYIVVWKGFMHKSLWKNNFQCRCSVVMKHFEGYGNVMSNLTDYVYGNAPTRPSERNRTAIAVKVFCACLCKLENQRANIVNKKKFGFFFFKFK